jgi:hypothetical protein
MVLLADYRLVEQGGLFFRKGKYRKLLPDMFCGAFGARATPSHGDRHNRAQSEADNTTAILP